MRHIHSIHAQNASDDCNLGETSDKLKLRELQQDNWPVHFKNVKVMKNKEIMKNCSKLKETTENESKRQLVILD